MASLADTIDNIAHRTILSMLIPSSIRYGTVYTGGSVR